MFYRDRNVLVTGGAGFVGSHLAAALRTAGANVRITVHHRSVPEALRGVQQVPANLEQAGDCRRAMEGVEFVFHAAGAVAGAGIGPQAVMAHVTTNLVLTARVLEAAWTAGVQRILLFSSSTAYPLADHPVREEELWNAPPFEGYFGYGWMRRYLERLGEFVARSSPLAVALARPTAVYGPGDNFDPACSHVVPALIRRVVEGEDPLVVWGTGEEVRDFLHVRDLARGCLLLLEKHSRADPVNLGYGEGTTIRQLVQVILEASGCGCRRMVFDKSKPIAIPRRLVDTSKARRLLGFAPEIPLAEGIAQTVAWWLREQELIGGTRPVA